MRRRIILRRNTLPRAGFALVVLSAPVIGATLARAAASAQNTTPRSSGQNSIHVVIKRRWIPYGQALTVTGRAPSQDRGERVQLQFDRAGGRAWRRIGLSHVGYHGRFHFHVKLRWSGRLKVTGPAHSGPARSADAPGTTTSTVPSTTPTPAPSADSGSSRAPAASRPRRVAVLGVLQVHQRSIHDLGNHPITVGGTLLPRARGRRVRLQTPQGRGWRTVATAYTGSKGRFKLRYAPHSSQRLRVHFAGNRSNGPVARPAGSVTVFSQSVASWYDDGGNTGCGFHAYYGVANVSLPCGTKVTFVYHGRQVTATVDDRGPYVGGRRWDLNQTTAGALGFGGVDTVWSSR